jgi:uncharacterized repeat protein (TIGR03837 family)
MISEPLRCDIFCRVIDNLGDAGVCWRLARMLAVEHGWRVRLWIDDPAPLAKLAPDHSAGPVEVCGWPAAWVDTLPAEVVVEAFACELPAAYVEAMVALPRAPAWINLEYLSAEDWVAGSHGLPSPHPRLPLVKHFFFPGFSARTGGLLRERDYDARKAAFDEAAFRAEFGLPPRRADELTISLFSYPDAPRDQLETALAAHRRPVHLLLPGSVTVPAARGSLTPYALPFLPQRRFDEILWACDLNFVRGEDSFVRAQWAAKPLVWQIYRQAGDAHLAKLDAFLARHPSGPAMQDFWRAWNGLGRLDWEGLVTRLPALEAGAADWARQLAQLPELATALVDFCRKSIK